MHRSDMVKTDGNFCTWSNLKPKNLQPRNFFFWHGLIDDIPAKLKNELKSKAIAHTPHFVPLDFYLALNSAKVSVS